MAAALVAVLALPSCDSHPATPTPGIAPRQVTVYGSGQVQGVPDTLTANLAIEFTAPDVSTAMKQTNDRQQAVINALVGAGLDRKDIRTTQVSLQPQYSTPEPAGPAAVSGYRATNAIEIKIHPTDTASTLLALVVSTGGDATRINSVSYSIADDSQPGQGRPGARLRRREEPRPAVRPAGRPEPGQGAVDLGGNRLHTAADRGPGAARRDGPAGTRSADGELLGDGGLGADLSY